LVQKSQNIRRLAKTITEADTEEINQEEAILLEKEDLEQIIERIAEAGMTAITIKSISRIDLLMELLLLQHKETMNLSNELEFLNY
jgi:hypothetical protein